MTLMPSSPDNPKRWLFGLACVATLSICVGLVVAVNSRSMCDATIYDFAVNSYRSGSYSQAIADCDNYLARWPSGDDADKMRELRRLAQLALDLPPSSSPPPVP